MAVTSPQRQHTPAADDGANAINEVRLVGRWQGTDERELPSGDVVVTGHVVVRRRDGGVDALDCAVWPAALRRKVLRWPEGVEVEVLGSLRRRFFRTPAGAASRYEVHVARIRRTTAARTGRSAPT